MKKSTDFGIMGVSLSAVVAVLFATGTLSFATQNTEPATYDQTSFMGHLILVQKDVDGNIKAYRQSDNIVTTVGKSCAITEIFGQASTNNTAGMCGGGGANSGVFNFVGIGTGSTGEVVGNTALETASGARQQDAGVGLVNSSGVYAIIEPSAFTGQTATITEAGLFDALTGNHMFARKTFTGIPLTTSDSLTVTWRVSVT